MVQAPIIQVKNLKKYYPLGASLPFQKATEFNKSVDDISFVVEKGETFGIVGESGSGKSTTAKLIDRLIEPTAGEIYFHQQNITQLTGYKELQNLRKSIQIIFQSPYGTLDPRKNIGFSLEEPFVINQTANKKERKQKVKELLELVGLSGSSISKYPHEFSGGQLQRINIARAIALNPEVVICDESVSALDVSVQAQILNLLNELQEELGLTYLFISHDLNVVKYMCKRIAVMQDGKIVEQGDSQEIYQNPQNTYTKKLLSSIPIESPYKRKN
ncbi:MAG TPA: ATP-binding cassette domain-containing protein [Tetragenococcus sp.]|nr:ATP-binding cassette domain-containing protein [Tetragenococcus sp.]